MCVCVFKRYFSKLFGADFIFTYYFLRNFKIKPEHGGLFNRNVLFRNDPFSCEAYEFSEVIIFKDSFRQLAS